MGIHKANLSPMDFVYSAFSFGAGVQSTALLLLLKHEPERLIKAVGHLPQKCYFADTGAEPKMVYEHLQKCISWSPIPLNVVSNGSLMSTEVQNGIQPRTFPPYFTRDRETGKLGMLMRKCTSEFKIVPIERAIRRDIGLVPKQRGKNRSVSLWLRISLEEASRMRDNTTKLFQNIYPLVEMGWDRSRCFAYCQSHGITPPKSRCFFCPFISDWNEIKRNQPEEFQRAVEFDRQIRNVVKGGVKGEVFVHKSGRPLEDVVTNQGHLWEKSPWEDDFQNECSGHCGV